MAAPVLHNLEAVLQQECTLQEEYLRLLEEERQALVKFNAEKIEVISERRELLLGRIHEASEKRKELIQKIPGTGADTRLTELRLPDANTQKVNSLAKELKALVIKTRVVGQELNQIVQFGMNIISGSISIFRSASNHVTRSYTAQGKIHEATHPSGPVRGGLAKEV